MSERNPNLLSPNFQQSSSLPNATASLVLGIISIVGAFCYGLPGLVCGIIGLVLANKDRKLYQENPELYSSASLGQSNGGRVCSIIGLSLSAIIILLYIIVIIFFGTLSYEAFRQYR